MNIIILITAFFTFFSFSQVSMSFGSSFDLVQNEKPSEKTRPFIKLAQSSNTSRFPRRNGNQNSNSVSSSGNNGRRGGSDDRRPGNFQRFLGIGGAIIGNLPPSRGEPQREEPEFRNPPRSSQPPRRTTPPRRTRPQPPRRPRQARPNNTVPRVISNRRFRAKEVVVVLDQSQ